MFKLSELLEMFSRQYLLKEVGINGQLRLLKTKVAVIGCGATGSMTAELLVRAGVGYVRVVDRDFIELSNIPRSFLHTVNDAVNVKPKAVSCVEKLSGINPYVKADYVISEANPRNIEDLVSDVDIIIDGTDNMRTRYLINDVALKLGKPWVMQGVSTWYGQVMFIKPRETACLRCVLPVPPPEVGDACNVLGVMNITVSMTASVTAGEVIKHVLGLGSGGELIYIDALRAQVNRFSLSRNPSCPACSLNRLEFLAPSEFLKVKRICGTNSIQVYPSEPVDLKIQELKHLNKLPNEIKIQLITPYLLKALVGGYEIVLFNDGRAIVNGLTDEELAVKIYEDLVRNLHLIDFSGDHSELRSS